MQHGIQIHPMLPPIAIEQDSMNLQQHNALNEYHNCQMYLPHTQVNASYNQQNYQLSQITNKRHSMTQMKLPPAKSFTSHKTAVDNAQDTMSRLYGDSIPNLVPTNIMSTTADRNNEATCHVRQYLSVTVNKLIDMTNKC